MTLNLEAKTQAEQKVKDNERGDRRDTFQCLHRSPPIIFTAIEDLPYNFLFFQPFLVMAQRI